MNFGSNCSSHRSRRVSTFNIQSATQLTTVKHWHLQNDNKHNNKEKKYPKARMARFSVTTALCLALTASSSQAFTGPQFQPVTRSPATSTTSLQMNLFDRFARVAKSNLNDIANKLEDPEKIMDQAINEMQVSLLFFGAPDLISLRYFLFVSGMT